MHVLPIPRHLPIERRPLSTGTAAGRRVTVSAITLDFGNTLVRVDRAGLRAVVEDTADGLERRGLVTDRAAFLRAWAEERDRQFREDVPLLREAEIPPRAVRVLARLRGMPPPPPEERWDDAAAGARVEAGEAEAVVEAYSQAFLDRMVPVPDARRTLEQLSARGFSLAILSNWPLATTIERFAEAQGWLPYLRAIVVSQRVGTIKPHPAIFAAAAEALGLPRDGVGLAPGAGGSAPPILHVGDDWAADVVGAMECGWRAAYLRNRQLDTPLPTSSRGAGRGHDADVVADLEIDELSELPDLVDLAAT